MLEWNNMKKQIYYQYLVGIDIGGTKTKAVLWDKKRISKSKRILTPNTNKELKQVLQGIIKELNPKKGSFLIGIGVAGVVKKTFLLSAPNLSKIKNLNFRKVFSESIPLLVDNDARCFLKGELVSNSFKKAKSVFGLTIGTGIGRAYAKNGVVQKIKRFEDHEQWEKEYQEIKNKKDYSLLAQFLGQKLFPLLKKYDPEVIVIGGGVIKNKVFFNKLCQELKKQGIRCKIKYSKLGENAVSLGSVLY